MKLFQQNGVRLILYTMRSGECLQHTIDFCKIRGITFWGINNNSEQESWTDSRKVYAHYYNDFISF